MVLLIIMEKKYKERTKKVIQKVLNLIVQIKGGLHLGEIRELQRGEMTALQEMNCQI